MMYSWLRFEVFIGILSEIVGNEIDEKFIIVFEDVGKGFGFRMLLLIIGINEWMWCISSI